MKFIYMVNLQNNKELKKNNVCKFCNLKSKYNFDFNVSKSYQ